MYTPRVNRPLNLFAIWLFDLRLIVRQSKIGVSCQALRDLNEPSTCGRSSAGLMDAEVSM
jgi:hypothetical protein